MRVMATGLKRLDDYRSWYFEWSRAPGVVKKLTLALGVAALTGVLAQIYVPLPFTPVPLTGQVIGVLLAGVLLGGSFGAVSMGIYVLLGLLVVPWFGGGAGGSFSYLLGPTGGYLLGFIAAAYLVGTVNDRFRWARSFLPRLCVITGGLLIIYAAGATWLAMVYHLGPVKAIALGVAPFLAVDAIKVGLAAIAGTLLTPRR